MSSWLLLKSKAATRQAFSAHSQAGAQALGGWLEATKEPKEALPDPSIFKAIEAASKQLSEERKTDRAKILEDIALQRTPMATARAALETLAWADLTSITRGARPNR